MLAAKYKQTNYRFVRALCPHPAGNPTIGILPTSYAILLMQRHEF